MSIRHNIMLEEENKMKVFSLKQMIGLKEVMCNKALEEDGIEHLMCVSLEQFLEGKYFEGYNTYKKYVICTQKEELEMHLGLGGFAIEALIGEKDYEAAEWILIDLMTTYSKEIIGEDWLDKMRESQIYMPTAQKILSE